MLVPAYRRIKALYGLRMAGFANMTHYSVPKITKRLHKGFIRASPSKPQRVWLTFCWLSKVPSEPQLMCTKDPAGNLPFAEDLKMALLWLYGHCDGALKATYVQGYHIQEGNWECGYIAFFASIGVLVGADPCNFNMDLKEVSKVVKLSVEYNEQGIAGTMLQQIWKKIASPKSRNPYNLTKYEPLKLTGLIEKRDYG